MLVLFEWFIFAIFVGFAIWLYRKLNRSFSCQICGEPASDFCMTCLQPVCNQHVDFEFDGYAQIPECHACAGKAAKSKGASA